MARQRASGELEDLPDFGGAGESEELDESEDPDAEKDRAEAPGDELGGPQGRGLLGKESVGMELLQKDSKKEARWEEPGPPRAEANG